MSDHARALYDTSYAAMIAQDINPNVHVLEFVARHHECKSQTKKLDKKALYQQLKKFNVKKEVINAILQFLRAFQKPGYVTYPKLTQHLQIMKAQDNTLNGVSGALVKGIE